MAIYFFSCAGFFGHIHEIFLVNVPQFNYVLIVIKLTALFVQEDNSNIFALWNYSHRLLNYLISNPLNIYSWRNQLKEKLWMTISGAVISVLGCAILEACISSDTQAAYCKLVAFCVLCSGIVYQDSLQHGQLNHSPLLSYHYNVTKHLL